MATYIIAAVTGLLLLGADQYTKYFVASHYTLGQSHDFIPGLIELTYVRNTGAAWGMLRDRTWLLIGITAVVMLICLALVLKYGTRNKLLFWAMTLVLSGGLGNMADRIFRGGSVVDFLQFDFWHSFPVFNVADCAICIGATLLVLYFILDLFREARNRSRKKNAPAENNET